MIKDVTELEVYTLSLNLLEPLYELVNFIPQQHKRMRYQLTGAAEAIAPQIAEGFGKKKSPREFCRFLSMALGSSDEVITHLREVKIISKRFERISVNDSDNLIEQYKILSKRLNRLHTVWQQFT